MIAQSFEEWRSCIENDCKIQLTKAFAQKRLSVYLNRKEAETQKFISLYGEQHLENIITWLKRI
ncbi:MAG: Unknown protein [uncultured Aureispira sp.]|uniref:Uncharacterized protein n=1 Tax=uncultured Aureispira sp. TaxID=1331704 RepID=A0A6S6RZG4_9BACT|nr:MAG: Unknown protein [uncultured Aureispira sp.]